MYISRISIHICQFHIECLFSVTHKLSQECCAWSIECNLKYAHYLSSHIHIHLSYMYIHIIYFSYMYIYISHIHIYYFSHSTPLQCVPQAQPRVQPVRHRVQCISCNVYLSNLQYISLKSEMYISQMCIWMYLIYLHVYTNLTSNAFAVFPTSSSKRAACEPSSATLTMHSRLVSHIHIYLSFMYIYICMYIMSHIESLFRVSNKLNQESSVWGVESNVEDSHYFVVTRSCKDKVAFCTLALRCWRAKITVCMCIYICVYIYMYAYYIHVYTYICIYIHI